MPCCSIQRHKSATTDEDDSSLVLFHTFLKKVDVQQLWVVAIHRDVKEGEFSIKRDTCVCSNHFKAEDYVGGRKVKGARLKTSAVPSVFSWTKETSRRTLHREQNLSSRVLHTCQTHTEWLEQQLENSRREIADLQDTLDEVHCKYFSLTITYERVKDTPTKLPCYTGLPNVDAFEAVWKFLDVEEDGVIGPSGKTLQQRRRSEGGGRKSALPLKEQLFWVLVRLRLGIDEELMADMVGFTQATISRIIIKWISFLYLKLGSLLIWPTAEQQLAYQLALARSIRPPLPSSTAQKFAVKFHPAYHFSPNSTHPTCHTQP